MSFSLDVRLSIWKANQHCILVQPDNRNYFNSKPTEPDVDLQASDAVAADTA